MDKEFIKNLATFCAENIRSAVDFENYHNYRLINKVVDSLSEYNQLQENDLMVDMIREEVVNLFAEYAMSADFKAKHDYFATVNDFGKLETLALLDKGVELIIGQFHAYHTERDLDKYIYYHLQIAAVQADLEMRISSDEKEAATRADINVYKTKALKMLELSHTGYDGHLLLPFMQLYSNKVNAYYNWVYEKGREMVTDAHLDTLTRAQSNPQKLLLLDELCTEVTNDYYLLENSNMFIDLSSYEHDSYKHKVYDVDQLEINYLKSVSSALQMFKRYKYKAMVKHYDVEPIYKFLIEAFYMESDSISNHKLYQQGMIHLVSQCFNQNKTDTDTIRIHLESLCKLEAVVNYSDCMQQILRYKYMLYVQGTEMISNLSYSSGRVEQFIDWKEYCLQQNDYDVTRMKDVRLRNMVHTHRKKVFDYFDTASDDMKVSISEYNKHLLISINARSVAEAKAPKEQCESLSRQNSFVGSCIIGQEMDTSDTTGRAVFAFGHDEQACKIVSKRSQATIVLHQHDESPYDLFELGEDDDDRNDKLDYSNNIVYSKEITYAKSVYADQDTEYDSDTTYYDSGDGDIDDDVYDIPGYAASLSA